MSIANSVLNDGLKVLDSIDPLKLYYRLRSELKGKAQIQLIGEKKLDVVQYQMYSYDKDRCTVEESNVKFERLQENSSDTCWLNFHGLHEVQLFEQLAKCISMDRLTLRKIPDTTQRAKVDEFDHYLFFNVKSILKDTDKRIAIEQISFILGEDYVISFQEEAKDHFDHIRNKLEDDLGLLRKKKSDFLLAQLIDAILDNYFESIEILGLEVSELERQVLKNPSQDLLLCLEQAKKEANLIRKSLLPIRESLRVILNSKTPLIKKNNYKYFNDLLNTCSSAIEETDSISKGLEGLTNVYFSALSQKMNETMKVLTLVATIFIPLTFIAGIYGMNFENMPELKYENGYFYTLGLMGVVFLLMVLYFKTRKWL